MTSDPVRSRSLTRWMVATLATLLISLLTAGSSQALCIDADGDGAFVGSCPGGTDLDCDDADPNNFPGNAEVCDGADNDCDTVADNGLPTVKYYDDLDGDGVGGTFNVKVCSALQPPGTSTDNTDCDDADPDNFPGNAEACDGADNDCDTLADEGLPTVNYYDDFDGDGVGSTFNVAV